MVNTEIDQEVAELHRVYAAALLRFAATYTSDTAACHDAVQEAFLRYFMEQQYGRRIANPRAWLYQVVRNHMLDGIKSAAGRMEVAVQQAEQVPAAHESPETAMEGTEAARVIAGALSNRELECLRLRSEGLSYNEIGEAMIVSPGTVAALLSRVHEKLHRMGGAWTFAVAREALRYLAMEASPAAPQL